MARQYRVRLGDGTVLAVEEHALNGWAVDEQALVQAPGDHAWRPLREFLADESGPAAARAKASVDLAEVARSSLTSPLADWLPPASARPSEGPPVIRLKPLEEEESALEELELAEPDRAGEHRQPTAAVARVEEVLQPLAAAFVRAVSLAVRWAGERGAALRKYRRRATAAAGTLAAAVAAVAVALNWPAAPPSPAPPTAPRLLPSVAPPPPTFPPEVLSAAAELPHLAPETVQLVMSRAGHLPDPPDVFRAAHLAARQGAPVLTPDEAQELGGLQSAIASRLRRPERDRLRAYERLRGGRHLLAGEDAKVMAVYARGVRGLPPSARERLQILLGRAVAAALAPSSPTPGGVAAAGPR